MSAQEIRGKPIADAVKEKIRATAAELAGRGIVPRFVSILVGDDPGVRSYVGQQAKAAADVGVRFDSRELPESTTEEELVRLIMELNGDPTATAVMLQVPVPEHIDQRRIQEIVAPEKDVDALSPVNQGLMLLNRQRLVPATAAAVLALVKSTGHPLVGAEATIIGRSEVAGKPSALLLMAEHCTPTICHTRTKDLGEHARRADILVVAAGQPDLVTGDMIQPGAVVIDVGINMVNGKMVGDVHYASASEVAGYITPVPGGVGPVTVAMLMHNVVRAAQWQQEPAEG
jgi:methylenetetrahydrofolate dehydrogenase (NADP+)/methenyltetrahydrofolate cyclohydrolase